MDESKQNKEQNYEKYNNYQSEKKKRFDFTKTVKRNHQFKEVGEQNNEIGESYMDWYKIMTYKAIISWKKYKN